jgi:hypothetical protein
MEEIPGLGIVQFSTLLNCIHLSVVQKLIQYQINIFIHRMTGMVMVLQNEVGMHQVKTGIMSIISCKNSAYIP